MNSSLSIWHYVVSVKSTVKISSIFVAFLENMNFNNSLFLSCQMGLSDGAFFILKHTLLPNGNHPISSPICPMGVADTLELRGLGANFFVKIIVW
jgi:hypothetical protein